YRWLRESTTITGATGTTYTPGSADQLHKISCVVHAQNGEGSAEATSGNSVEIPGAAPELVEAPEISGVERVGEELTCWEGKWNGAPTFSYHWLRDGAPISFATTSSYTVVELDRAHQLSCEVTAT